MSQEVKIRFTADVDDMEKKVERLEKLTKSVGGQVGKLNITYKETAEGTKAFATVSAHLSKTLGRESSAIKKLTREASSLGGQLNTVTQAQDKFSKNARLQLVNVAKYSFLYGGMAAALYQIDRALVSIIDKGIDMQATSAVFSSTFGSGQAMAKEFEYLEQTADKFGIRLDGVREQYRNFATAAKLANVSAASTRSIFEKMALSARVLHLSTDNTKAVFVALNQMMNKNKITAEELQNQLGERLPGAVAVMAKSLGLQIPEMLAKMKKGQIDAASSLENFAKTYVETFSDEAIAIATDGLQARAARLANTWDKLAITIFNKVQPALETIVSGGQAVLGTLQALGDNGTLSTIATGLEAIAVLYAVKMIPLLKQYIVNKRADFLTTTNNRRVELAAAQAQHTASIRRILSLKTIGNATRNITGKIDQQIIRLKVLKATAGLTARQAIVGLKTQAVLRAQALKQKALQIKAESSHAGAIIYTTTAMIAQTTAMKARNVVMATAGRVATKAAVGMAGARVGLGLMAGILGGIPGILTLIAFGAYQATDGFAGMTTEVGRMQTAADWSIWLDGLDGVTQGAQDTAEGIAAWAEFASIVTGQSNEQSKASWSDFYDWVINIMEDLPVHMVSAGFSILEASRRMVNGVGAWFSKISPKLNIALQESKIHAIQQFDGIRQAGVGMVEGLFKVFAKMAGSAADVLQAFGADDLADKARKDQARILANMNNLSKASDKAYRGKLADARVSIAISKQAIFNINAEAKAFNIMSQNRIKQHRLAAKARIQEKNDQKELTKLFIEADKSFQGLSNRVKPPKSVIPPYVPSGKDGKEGKKTAEQKAREKASKKARAEEDKLRKSFEKTRDALTLNSAKYTESAEKIARMGYASKGFTTDMQDELIALDKVGQLLKEQDSLKNEKASLNPNITASYEAELNKTLLDGADIAELVAEKRSIALAKVTQALDKQYKAVTLNKEQFARWELEQQGYSASARNTVMLKKQRIAYAELTRELNKQEAEAKLTSSALRELQLVTENSLSPTQAHTIHIREQAIAYEKLIKSIKAQQTALQSSTRQKEDAILKEQGYSVVQRESIIAEQERTKSLEAMEAAGKRVETGLIDGLSGALAKVATGTRLTKADFSDMAKSMIADMIRIAIQKKLTGLLSGVFGSLGGGASNIKLAHTGGVQSKDKLGIFHGGGIIGNAGLEKTVVNGKSLQSDERLIVTQVDEGIFTTGQMKSMAPVSPIVRAISKLKTTLAPNQALPSAITVNTLAPAVTPFGSPTSTSQDSTRNISVNVYKGKDSSTEGDKATATATQSKDGLQIDVLLGKVDTFIARGIRTGSKTQSAIVQTFNINKVGA